MQNLTDMGKVAFLNGQLGMQDDVHFSFFNSLNALGVEVRLIDNLFNRPQSITMLEVFDTIVVGSVNFEKEKIKRLAESFVGLKKIPKNVIFYPKAEPFIQWMQEMPQDTNFFLLEFPSMDLQSIKLQ